VIFIKTITIVTPSNIEVEYRLAGVGSRLAAFIIDFALQLAMIIIVALAVLGVDYYLLGNDGLSGVAIGVMLVLGFVIYFGYFILCEMIMNGQTLGKRVFGLRAIRENGQPLEFAQALVRGLVRSSADMMYVGLFVIFFHPLHKRLGDMAAGTVVISEKYGASFELTLLASNWPQYLPSPMEVTNDERQLIEEWLRRRNNLSDYGDSLGRKLATYFSEKRSAINESTSNQWQPPGEWQHSSDA